VTNIHIGIVSINVDADVDFAKRTDTLPFKAMDVGSLPKLAG
jgi:hypothetical protein